MMPRSRPASPHPASPRKRGEEHEQERDDRSGSD